MPSTQQSARECFDYVKEICDNPSDEFDLKLVNIDGECHTQNSRSGTFIEDAILWMVEPRSRDVKITGKPAILTTVVALLQGQGIAGIASTKAIIVPKSQ